MKIGGLQKLSLIDYPGKPACTVFLSGCNLKCGWCHSPQLVVDEKIESSPGIKRDQLFDFLKKRVNVLDGVVICGGEPTIHDQLFELIKEIKDLGYAVKLDTNGTNPEMIKRLSDADLLDYVAMDLKAPLEKYKKATGVSVSSSVLRKSIALIKDLQDYEFRTTIIPGIHEKRDIIDIAHEIRPAKRYYLQNFRNKRTVDDSFKDKKAFDKKFLKKIKGEIEDFFEICEIR